MYSFYVILKRDFINLALNPVILLTNTVFPLVLVLVLGYLSNGAYSGEDMNGYDYYGVTIMVYTAVNVSMTAANSFMERTLKSSNLRILYSPIPRAFVYLSKITATVLFCGLSMLITLAVLNWGMDVHLGGADIGYVAVLLLLLMLMSAALGVWLCCLFKSEEASNKLLSMINNVLALLGGLFFQLDGLGETVAKASYFSPVKWVSEAIFRIIYDHDPALFATAAALMLGATALLLLGCKLTFKTEDYV
ncbi:ABC transporter permease [Paenibacillus elgii]|uniref:ABC transporter permease n=1 Tax=Paenibacillus elgii TaxID=189691 RepID=UPI000248C661|nr:ABC transporter permease [Paenibacillus elgii]